MTEEELRYVLLLHETARSLEELGRAEDIPEDVARHAEAMRVIRIGEASRQIQKRLPQLAGRLEDRLPEVRWKSWRGLRNVLAHNLFEVDREIVADAVSHHAPLLRHGLEREFGAELAQEFEREPHAERRPAPEVEAPQPSPVHAPRTERHAPVQGGRTHDPDLLDFCYRRRGLQPGQEPTEQDIVVYKWVRAPKRVNPRLVAARSLGRERRAILRRERGG